MLGAADLSRATASGARLGASAGLSAAARAAVAGRKTRDIDLLLDAGECLLEGDGEVVAEVVAAIRTLTPRARADAATEESVEDVRKRHVGKVDRGSSARVDGRVAEHVVGAPAAGVRKNGIRLAGLFEAGGGDRIVRVAVRVRVHRDLAEGPLQLVGRRLPADAENLVVIAPDSH